MELYPLFPLELVVFPLEKLNLHIFETRYKELISDSMNENIVFGIPTYHKKEPMQYGSLLRLIRIDKKYSDGRMDVKTEGIQVFRLHEYLETYPEKLYPGGYIENLDLDIKSEIVTALKIKEKLLELYDFMKIKSIPDALKRENYITFEIAHKVGFNRNQEYEFLQIPTEYKRQEFLLNHLNHLIPIARNMEEMRQKIQNNGHFKDVLPPNI